MAAGAGVTMPVDGMAALGAVPDAEGVAVLGAGAEVVGDVAAVVPPHSGASDGRI